MTRVIREGKRRRTPLLLMVLMGVMAGVLIGGGSFSSAAPSTDASVVDYSQCAQGSPGTAVPPTGSNIGTCVQGWINGILQGSNSQYAEDQVTAQRLVIDLPKGGSVSGRTITLKYLWNKGTNHAYDSLARWNTTINWLTAAGVCAGVPGGSSGCPANDGTYDSTNGLGTSQNNSAAQVPTSVCSDGSKLGGFDHQLSDRTLGMFGGTITGISSPLNDSSTCSTTADEYETVTITYSVPAGSLTSGDRKVMLLFGGHLAAGGGPRSWGAGKGSSAINGGPYHIKLTNLDSSSIGNRDNQISSGAILPLATGVSTTLHQTDSTGTDVGNNESGTAGLTVNMPSGGGGVYVTDYATVTPTGATGTVDFAYYSTLTACQAATNASEGGTSAGTGKTLNSSGVATSNTINFTSIGTIYWRAFFQGTDISTDSASGCSDEVLTVNQDTSASTTLHQTDSTGTDITPTANNDASITVPINSYVVDYASVTPSSATGSVDFRYYSSSTACSGDTTGSSGTDAHGSTFSSGSSHSDTVQFTSAGDFYFRAFFSGTNGNNSSYNSTCEHLIVQAASPTVASDPRLIPQDHATLAGIASGGSGATITFTLYAPAATACGGSVLYSEQQNVTGNGGYTTSNPGTGSSPSGYKLTSSSTKGVYYWRVNYSGDSANNANNSCSESFDFEGITDKSAG